MIKKIKDRFEWAKCQDNLSREDMLDQLKDDIFTVLEEYDELLLDVLNQACGDGKGEIDNQCLSAYEDACDYLEKKGLLEKVNSRIYNIK